MDRSIENILNHIKENTKKEIEKIKNDCFLKCREIVEKAKEELKKDSEKTKEKIKIKKDELRKNYDIELIQIKNKFFMQKKEEIFKKTLETAFYFFCEDKKEIYFKFILNLLSKNIPQEKAKIFIGNKDYERLKQEILKFDNFEIEKSFDFEYGFKIENKKYILNFDLREIFTQNLDKIKKITLDELEIKDVTN